VAVSAIGLGATGLAELLLAVLTGSVGLLGDAIHNLSDVSTSAVVFLGFRLSRRPATEHYPYGLERAEDLAGIGIAVVIWASAAFAGYESIRKLIGHGHTSSCPKRAASPGPAAQAPADYYLSDGGPRRPTAAEAAVMTMVSYRCGTTGLVVHSWAFCALTAGSCCLKTRAPVWVNRRDAQPGVIAAGLVQQRAWRSASVRPRAGCARKRVATSVNVLGRWPGVTAVAVLPPWVSCQLLGLDRPSRRRVSLERLGCYVASAEVPASLP
jgi:hypothetical protein